MFEKKYDDKKQMIATANSVKDRLRRRAAATGEPYPNAKQRGAMVGTLNKYLGGDNMRKIVLSWVFAGDFEAVTVRSSKSLTASEYWAIIEWIGWWKDDDQNWQVGEHFQHEAICVLNAAVRAYNMSDLEKKRNIAVDETMSLVNNAISLGGLVTDLDKEDVEWEDFVKN